MLFLHGGGDNPEARIKTFGRFVQASTVNTVCTLALVVAESTAALARESFAAYSTIFTTLPNAPTHIHPVFVSTTVPLQAAQLERIQPSGVFVCGGSTPLYHRALCLDTRWVQYLLESNIPYGGTSAGATIAARQAILGGWQSTQSGKTRPILFRGASEGLDPLTVQAGLGLVPFAVDVHASQMGTLTRLIHAVGLGLVAEGWAIDENTLLQIEAGEIKVFGQGQAYRVSLTSPQTVNVTIYTDSSKPRWG